MADQWQQTANGSNVGTKKKYTDWWKKKLRKVFATWLNVVSDQLDKMLQPKVDTKQRWAKYCSSLYKDPERGDEGMKWTGGNYIRQQRRPSKHCMPQSILILIPKNETLVMAWPAERCPLSITQKKILLIILLNSVKHQTGSLSVRRPGRILKS